MRKLMFMVLGAWMVATLAVLGSLAGDSGGGAEDPATTSGGQPAVLAPAGSGVPVDHLGRHAQMTSQMRAARPDAQMGVRMAGDPMWQMMRDPGHIRAEEEYQQGIDRMLARVP